MPQLANKRLFTGSATLLVALVLTACVPVVSYDYDIEGQGDKSKSGGCSPTTEVLLSTHLTAATSAVFWGSVERLNRGHRIASISFVFSNDEVLTLTKPEVRVESATYLHTKVVPIETVRRSSSTRSPSCDPPDDSTYQSPAEPMSRARDPLNSVYVIDVEFPNDPRVFTIRLGAVMIDGQRIDVPAVTFLRKATVSLPAQVL